MKKNPKDTYEQGLKHSGFREVREPLLGEGEWEREKLTGPESTSCRHFKRACETPVQRDRE